MSEAYIKHGFRETSPMRTPEQVAESVGKGWKQIVLDLCADLRHLGWDGRLVQIKEKFGGLRFYINAGSLDVRKRISEAERLSSSTCEECGQPGCLRNGSWLKTLCDEHANGAEPSEY